MDFISNEAAEVEGDDFKLVFLDDEEEMFLPPPLTIDSL